MKKHINIVLSLCIVLACSSCVSVEPVRERMQLQQTDSSTALSVLTKDGVMYHLDHYAIQGSEIHGSGSREFAGRTIAYEGMLALDDIEYAQVERYHGGGTIAAAATAAVIAGAVVAATVAERKTEVKPYPREGESCPYVYSWNGERYVLEAETFGTSLGKALQRTTRHVLPSLKPEQGRVCLRIRNERPETHYIDRVGLRRYRHEAGTRLQLDTKGNAWQVSRCADAIDAQQMPDGTHVYRFASPDQAGSALLIVTAKNREMTGGIFQETFAWLGNEALPFVRDLEKDAETVRLLRDWLQRCALEVTAGFGQERRSLGVIDPEGTAVPFTRVLPLGLEPAQGEDVTVRLASLPGLWEILDVKIAWDSREIHESTALPVQQCQGPQESDVHSLLAEEDESYCTLLPPQAVEMSFSVDAPADTAAYSYVVEASGYLHLWFRPGEQCGLFTAFDSVPPGERRAFVRSMMERPELVLPLLSALAKP